MPSYPNPKAHMCATPLILSPRVERGAGLLATGLVGAVMFLLASAVPAPAHAQSDPKAPRAGACENTPHVAETPPTTGANSGTKPGNEGSTGWTGGTGGTYTGLTPQSGTPASPERQPEVVTGVDPKTGPQVRC